MAQHQLVGWTFSFNSRKRSMGLCLYATQSIELSIHLVDRNSDAEIVDTLLHEIAHALVGPGHGHDSTWKQKCLEIGATPKRCGDADMPTGRWQASCGGCQQSFSRHRKPRTLTGWHCRSCGSEKGRLTWRYA